ncbi:hypothetical protein V6N13_071383 [Hibiscus sabdariffa]
MEWTTLQHLNLRHVARRMKMNIFLNFNFLFSGTSADQDTRFSNKQAKLLKSQKFAPELEHLVNMTKVKMDVIRPWIATRVTELLGFEDEVLINFIYGLLDEKGERDANLRNGGRRKR